MSLAAPQLLPQDKGAGDLAGSSHRQVADDQVHFAIAVPIPDRTRHMIVGAGFQGMAKEKKESKEKGATIA